MVKKKTKSTLKQLLARYRAMTAERPKLWIFIRLVVLVVVIWLAIVQINVLPPLAWFSHTFDDAL